MGLFTRILAGGAAGGVYGYAASDNTTATGLFKDTVGGAMIGAGIATGTARSLWTNAPKKSGFLKGIAGAPKGGVARAGWGAMGAGYSLGKIASLGAFKAGKFAMNNPKTALAIGGTGIGLAALANSGPAQSDLTGDEMAALAVSQGVPSTGFAMGNRMGRAAFEGSTNGLTLGLHKGRHR